MNPDVHSGYYIGILTVWNLVLIVIAYLYYRHVCTEMNYHLKNRRMKAKSWNETRRRDSSLYSNWGDNVLGTEDEDSVRSPLVESESSFRRRVNPDV